MGPAPAVAAVRSACRAVLAQVPTGATVMVACSGGADSLALLAATVFEARRDGLRVVGAVVDHGLHDDSDQHTAAVVAQMAGLGVDETASIRVRVESGGVGLEAGAREARYAALRQLAEHFDAAAVLLGHTRDDQAETVLLGLARGSGTRSLSGMRRSFEVFHRPLLEVGRDDTEAACRAEGIDVWIDPHNSDPRFLRARVRHDVVPVLERELGPGVAEALARTAASAREDADALDDLAEAEWALLQGDAIPVERLRALLPALRTRVLRLAILAAGAPATDLTSVHLRAAVDLVTRQPGEPKTLQLPGGVRLQVAGGLLRFPAY